MKYWLGQNAADVYLKKMREATGTTLDDITLMQQAQKVFEQRSGHRDDNPSWPHRPGVCPCTGEDISEVYSTLIRGVSVGYMRTQTLATLATQYACIRRI